MKLLTIDQFVAKYNGNSVTMDGNFPKGDPYQCWDLAEAYCEEVLGIPKKPWALPTKDGTAYGSYEFKPAPLGQYFSRRVRKHIGPVILNSRPPRGALVFWRRNLPGSENAGHVDICLSHKSDNKHGFLGFDQNWAGKYAHRVNHNYQYVDGYLVPKMQVK